MELQEALWDVRDRIIDQWVNYTLSTYKSSEFFKGEKDKFANPIGGSVREALSALFVLILKGEEGSDYSAPVEQLMKLRSVQEFSPSQAVAPLNAVKHITRDVIKKDKDTQKFVNELYDFDFAVDLAVLAAFDLYMHSRERLYQVRINEIKSGNHILTDSKCPSNLLKDISKSI